MAHTQRLAVGGWAACGLAMAMTLGPALARAQSVAMTGSMGSKALLVVNGGPPKALAAGDTHAGVKVLSVKAHQVVVEIAGKRETVPMGGAPVSVGAGGGGAGSGTQIVLSAGSGGHFTTQGTINGRSTSFVVDTGATSVAMGLNEAKRLGIAYEQARTYMSGTANGNVLTYKVYLTSLRIQDVEVNNVEAAVVSANMPYILLGNTFLTRFQMKRENDVLTLTRRF